MAAQFGQAPPASLPEPALGTSATSDKPLLQAPHRVLLEGTLSQSSAGNRVQFPSSVRHWSPFMMAEDVTGTVFCFAAA